MKKGETFNQSLVAMDQVNHTLSNIIIIHSSLMFKESGIGEGQLSQKTGDYCTSLNFTPYSFEEVNLAICSRSVQGCKLVTEQNNHQF